MNRKKLHFSQNMGFYVSQMEIFQKNFLGFSSGIIRHSPTIDRKLIENVCKPDENSCSKIIKKCPRNVEFLSENAKIEPGIVKFLRGNVKLEPRNDKNSAWDCQMYALKV